MEIAIEDAYTFIPENATCESFRTGDSEVQIFQWEDATHKYRKCVTTVDGKETATSLRRLRK